MSELSKKAVFVAAGADSNTLPGKVSALLLNLPGNAYDEKSIEESQKLIKLSGASSVYLDSGGFQLHLADENKANDDNLPVAKKEKKVIGTNPYKPIHYVNKNGYKVINLTPENLMFATKELKPDVLMALDYPIKSNIEEEEHEVEFYRKLFLNVKWAKETSLLRRQRCPNVALYLPIQAYNIKQLVEYLNLIKGVEYEGFSLPMRNMSISDLINFMTICSRQGAKRFHLLGVAKYETLVISAYCGYHLFEIISWDATTWRMSAERFQYVDYRNLDKFLVYENNEMVEELMTSCPCPWCQASSQNISTLYKDELMSLLRCHNFWVTNKVCLELHDRAKDFDSMTKFIKDSNSHKSEKASNLLGLLKYSQMKINNFLSK